MSQQLLALKNVKAITFPRSGLNFFKACLAMNGLAIESSHFPKDPVMGNKYASIIRNPKDSVASEFIMKRKFAAQDDDYYIKHTEEEIIDATINQYILVYEWILKNSDYIIKFEDLTKNTDQTIKFFLISMSSKLETAREYDKINIENNLGSGHISTSKFEKGYDQALVLVLRSSLFQKAEDVYRQACVKSAPIAQW